MNIFSDSQGQEIQWQLCYHFHMLEHAKCYKICLGNIITIQLFCLSPQAYFRMRILGLLSNSTCLSLVFSILQKEFSVIFPLHVQFLSPGIISHRWRHFVQHQWFIGFKLPWLTYHFYLTDLEVIQDSKYKANNRWHQLFPFNCTLSKHFYFLGLLQL